MCLQQDGFIKEHDLEDLSPSKSRSWTLSSDRVEAVLPSLSPCLLSFSRFISSSSSFFNSYYESSAELILYTPSFHYHFTGGDTKARNRWLAHDHSDRKWWGWLQNHTFPSPLTCLLSPFFSIWAAQTSTTCSTLELVSHCIPLWGVGNILPSSLLRNKGFNKARLL